MSHVVLLGDSIFDNGAYVGRGPDVITQVRALLPSGWRATLLAVDGSMTENIPGQLASLPPDASHLVLSIGGNNAILHASRHGLLLFAPAALPATEFLDSLSLVPATFGPSYRQAVNACLKTGLPLVLCTIYNGCLPDQASQHLATRALAIFNDVITKTGAELGLKVIDLRPICCDPQDYANPIEPSAIGGEKIARAVVAAILR